MKLTIYRPKEEAYKKRNYRILFNSQILGYISAGETLDFELTDTGELQFKIDGITGSKKVAIDPKEDKSVVISGKKFLSHSPVILIIFLSLIAVFSIRYQVSFFTPSLAILFAVYFILISLFRKNWLNVKILI